MSDERGIPWAGERLVPKQMNIEITAACNLKCKFCPRPLDVHTHMDPELYKSIVDRVAIEMPDVSIVPYLNGEPLLHPDYAELIKYTTAAGLRVYFTTNGTIWNDELFEHCTERNSFYQVIVSLDGIPEACSRSIEIARPGTDRKTVVGNIERLGRLKMAKGNHMDLAVKIVRRGQDWEEIERYVDYWLRKPYIDYVCIGDTLLDYNEESMRIYPCQYSDNMFMLVKADGRLAACAYGLEMTNNPDYGLGWLDKTTPLLDLYNSPAYQEFWDNQRKGVFTEPCSHCTFAFTGYGFSGTVRFRNPELMQDELYFHRDYYNSFFSKKHQEKPVDYYLTAGRVDEYPDDITAKGL